MSAIEELYPVDCPFCAIADAHPPPSSSEDIIPEGPPASSVGGGSTAYMILNTSKVLAFLDHAPISRGHVLIIAREHRSKLSDCRVDEAQALGAWLPIISRAVMNTVDPEDGESSSRDIREGGIGDWNIVQNNGARAAQVVPHVHFHVIPRSGAVPEVKARSWTIFGRGQRQDLDDDEAEILVHRLREQLSYELDELSSREGETALDSLLSAAYQGSSHKL